MASSTSSSPWTYADIDATRDDLSAYTGNARCDDGMGTPSWEIHARRVDVANPPRPRVVRPPLPWARLSAKGERKSEEHERTRDQRLGGAHRP